MTLTEALDELGVPYANAGESRHVMAGWIGIDCPLCSPRSGKFKLGIKLATLWTTCWSCGKARLSEALAEISGRPASLVRGLLAQLEGFPLPERDRSSNGILRYPGGAGPLFPAHRHYLKGRGIDVSESVELWGLLGIGPASRLAWRVLIPIRTAAGRPVSWTTRTIGEREPRYVNARPDEEAMPAKSQLLGLDLVRHAAVAVEGPMDALRIGPGAVATMGVGYSDAQLALLSKIPVRAVCFDSEPEAQRRADKLCGDLSAFPGVTRRVELDAKDPGSASDREIKLLRRSFL